MEIIVKTQAELDAAVAAEYTEFSYIFIHGGTRFDRLVVRARPKNAVVVASGSSSVVAWGSSSVVARESSRVEAWGSSSVEAWESSSVVARGSSSVVARESSSVEARGAASVHVHSDAAKVSLFGFAVGILLVKTLLVLKKVKTATIVRPKLATGVAAWLEGQGVVPTGKTVVLFKRVSKDWKTQEGTSRETSWAPGTTQVHPAWGPTEEECNGGKFHACSRAYFCDEFRDKRDDRYVAIEIAVKDLYAWPTPTYPHKIAFRAGVVLHEVNKHGKKLTAAAVPA